MQQVFLKMVPDGVNPVIYATQNDDGRVFRFKLLNSDESDAYVLNGTETITAKIVKPDNTEITIAITNPGIGKDYCDMVIGSDDCDLAGVYIGEVSLLDYGRPLGSLNFILKVEPDAYDGVNVVVMDCGPADICTFETNLADNLVSLKASIVASGGNGTPSTPIPIVGHSELNLVRCGVNLFDKNQVNTTVGFIDDNGNITYSETWKTSDYLPIVAGDYTFSGVDIALGGYYGICWYDVNKTLIGGFSSFAVVPVTVTIPSGASFIRYSWSIHSADTFMMNTGSSALPYAPYNGQTFTVSFGQTVYGGVYDANAGKVRITNGIVDLGTLTWVKQGLYNSKYGFLAYLTGIKTVSTPTTKANMICDTYITRNGNDVYLGNDGISMWSTEDRISIYDSTKESLTETQFKTAMSGIYLVYELATPIEIDVSELAVAAIVGVNNVFCDTGETELKYLKIEG